MRWISAIAAVLVCAACQSRPDADQLAALAAQPQLSEPVCHDFKAPVNAGGRQEQASGQACEQPDGSWNVVQNTPGLPSQGYVLEPAGQPAAAANAASPPQPDQPPCSSYTAPVTVGGQPRQAIIEACPQPDGSWKITQNTPGLPTQVYQVRRPRPPPILIPTRIRSTMPTPTSFHIGWARRGFLASGLRSSSCNASTILTMALVTASGMVSLTDLGRALGTVLPLGTAAAGVAGVIS